MSDWKELKCKNCGLSADIGRDQSFYKCPACGSMYERLRGTPRGDVFIDAHLAQTRNINDGEFSLAKDLLDTLPIFVRRSQATLDETQRLLAEAKSDENIARTQTAKEIQERQNYLLGFAAGAALMFIIGLNSASDDSALFALLVVIAMIAGVAYNWNKLKQAKGGAKPRSLRCHAPHRGTDLSFRTAESRD